MMARDLLAMLLIDLGRHRAAEDHLDRALSLMQASGIAFWLPRITADRAIARLRQGHLDPAGNLEHAATRSGPRSPPPPTGSARARAAVSDRRAIR